MRAATVVQVLQDLFLKFYCMFYFTCDRSLIGFGLGHKDKTLGFGLASQGLVDITSMQTDMITVQQSHSK